MICQCCRGSGRVILKSRGVERNLPCINCQGHGELTPVQSLADCWECGKPLRQCRCNAKAEK